MASEEILKLPKEVFIQYMKDSESTYFKNLKKIENPDYENYSLDDKINYWTENLHEQMRLQVESGIDPYLIFTPEWYDAYKRIEQNLDIIMEGVSVRFKSFNWEFKWEEYQKRIHPIL